MSELVKREHRLSKYLEMLNPDVEDKPELTEKEEEIWRAIQHAYSLRVMFKSPDKVRKELMTFGEGRKYSSACQVYQDMEYIYGETAEVNKNAERRIIRDFIYSRIEALTDPPTFRDGEREKNLDRVEVEKLIQKWTENLIKLGEFGTGNMPRPEDLMPKPVINLIVGSAQQVQVAHIKADEK